MEAPKILQSAAETMNSRAAERDTEAERSMARTVKAFNAMYDKDLTEVEGWRFMEMLKMARAHGGVPRLDDYLDGAAYSALAGEAALKEVSHVEDL